MPPKHSYEFHYYSKKVGWNGVYLDSFRSALLIKILYGCYLHKALSNGFQVIFMGRVNRTLMPLHMKRYMFNQLHGML